MFYESIFERRGGRFALRKCDKTKVQSCFLISMNRRRSSPLDEAPQPAPIEGLRCLGYPLRRLEPPPHGWQMPTPKWVRPFDPSLTNFPILFLVAPRPHPTPGKSRKADCEPATFRHIRGRQRRQRRTESSRVAPETSRGHMNRRLRGDRRRDAANKRERRRGPQPRFP